MKPEDQSPIVCTDSVRPPASESHSKLSNLLLDPLPEGWRATNAGPCDYLTDEANEERRVYVERVLPPFSGKDGLRTWSGPTLYAALDAANKSLGIDCAVQTGDSPESEIERLKAEINEQARLLGMGAERELSLLATVESQRRTIESMASCAKNDASMSADVQAMARALDEIFTKQNPGAWRTPELCALILKYK